MKTNIRYRQRSTTERQRGTTKRSRGRAVPRTRWERWHCGPLLSSGAVLGVLTLVLLLAQPRTAGARPALALSGTSYALTDALHSVRMLADSSGIPVVEQAYTANGQVLHSSQPGAAGLGFSGQDALTACVSANDARARNHCLGRFLQRDPLDTGIVSMGDPVGAHRYTDVNNNPVNRRDPTGHFSIGPSAVEGPWPEGVCSLDLERELPASQTTKDCIELRKAKAEDNDRVEKTQREKNPWTREGMDKLLESWPLPLAEGAKWVGGGAAVGVGAYGTGLALDALHDKLPKASRKFLFPKGDPNPATPPCDEPQTQTEPSPILGPNGKPYVPPPPTKNPMEEFGRLCAGAVSLCVPPPPAQPQPPTPGPGWSPSIPDIPIVPILRQVFWPQRA